MPTPFTNKRTKKNEYIKQNDGRPLNHRASLIIVTSIHHHPARSPLLYPFAVVAPVHRRRAFFHRHQILSSSLYPFHRRRARFTVVAPVSPSSRPFHRRRALSPSSRPFIVVAPVLCRRVLFPVPVLPSSLLSTVSRPSIVVAPVRRRRALFTIVVPVSPSSHPFTDVAPVQCRRTRSSSSYPFDYRRARARSLSSHPFVIVAPFSPSSYPFTDVAPVQCRSSHPFIVVAPVRHHRTHSSSLYPFHYHHAHSLNQE